MRQHKKRVTTGVDGEITLFVVNKNERGSGISRKLLTECLKIIGNAHYQKIFFRVIVNLITPII